MSIDEVLKIAATFGPDSLRAAIEQHVAEAVAREREECAKACESQAARWRPDQRRVYVSYECADAIRARADKETT